MLTEHYIWRAIEQAKRIADRIDERWAALAARSVPGDGGAARQNGKCSDPLPAARSIAGGTCGAPDEYSGDWPDHRVDLGLGNRRGATLFVDGGMTLFPDFAEGG